MHTLRLIAGLATITTITFAGTALAGEGGGGDVGAQVVTPLIETTRPTLRATFDYVRPLEPLNQNAYGAELDRFIANDSGTLSGGNPSIIRGTGNIDADTSDPTFSARVRLNFDTSFTGEDRLRTRPQFINSPDGSRFLTDEELEEFDVTDDFGDIWLNFPVGGVTVRDVNEALGSLDYNVAIPHVPTGLFPGYNPLDDPNGQQRDIVRYDSPTVAGFSLSSDWGASGGSGLTIPPQGNTGPNSETFRYVAETRFGTVAADYDIGGYNIWIAYALPDVRDSASTRDPDPDMQFNSIFLEDASSPPDGAATGGAGGVPVEGNYRFRLNDRITITPAVIFLPQEETDDVVIGTIRTRFRF